MTQYWMPVPVPAIIPEAPQYTLRKAAIKPADLADQRIEQFAAGQLDSLPPDLLAELHANSPVGGIGKAAWTRGITYAPYARIPGAARSPYDTTTVDLPALAAPYGLALAGTTGGTLTPTSTYKYEVTAVNANGETLPCTAVSITLGSGKTGVILTWQAVADNVTYNVYGRVSGSLGLLASIPAVSADAGATVTYTDLGATIPGVAPPGTNTTAGPGAYTNPPIRTVVPWVLLAQYGATAFGFSELNYKDRATAFLEAEQDYQLEYEFWTGTLAQANSWPNQYLTSITNNLTPGSGACSVARGQQILQDYLEQTSGRGMIHCQAQTLPNLLTATINPGDEVIEDLRGNLIVAGSGYPGTGPGGASPSSGTSWMFATDMVAIRLEDEASVYPNTFAEAMDWGQSGFPNTIRFRAEKLGMAYADLTVGAAVNVTLAT